MPLWTFRVLLVASALACGPARPYAQTLRDLVRCPPNDAETQPSVKDACIICDLDGFTGRNQEPLDLKLPGPGDVPGGAGSGVFCTTVAHNIGWIGFIAGSTEITLDFTVDNCFRQPDDEIKKVGLEAGVYRMPDNLDPLGAVLVSDECYPDIPQWPQDPNNLTETVPFTMTNLVVGQTYFFVLDGNAGDQCDYSIAVTKGTTVLPDLEDGLAEIVGPTSLCPGDPASFEIPVPYPEIGFVQYYRWTVDGVPVAGSDGRTPEVTTDFPAAGEYEVCVTAGYACDEAQRCRTVTVACDETEVSAEATDPACGQTAGAITVAAQAQSGTVTVDYAGPATGTVSIPGDDSPTVIPDLPPGTYQVTFAGAGVAETVSVTIAAAPPSPAVAITSPDLTELSPGRYALDCADGATGTLLAEAAGGDAATYAWDDPAASTTATLDVAGAGTYTVTATTAAGCTGAATVEVAAPTPITFSVEPRDPSCAADAEPSGIAFADVSGGTPPYTFLVNGNAQSATGSFVALQSGTYDVQVVGAEGCESGVVSATVAAAPECGFAVTATGTDPACGETLGAIAVSAVRAGGGEIVVSYGGPASGQLTIAGDGTEETIADLPAGEYEVLFEDGSGEQELIVVVLATQSSPAVAITSPDLTEVGPGRYALACGDGAVGTLVAEVVGGGTFAYAWDDPAATSSPTLGGVGVGTYAVAAVDAAGCGGAATVEIVAPEPITFTPEPRAADCGAGAEPSGVAFVDVAGGSPPYTFEVDGGVRPATAGFVALPPGGYEVRVLDAGGCASAPRAVTVGAGPECEFAVMATGIDPACGETLGAIAFSATRAGGGAIEVFYVGPVTGELVIPSDGAATTVVDLPVGAYDVAFADEDGEVVTRAVTLVTQAGPSLAVSSPDLGALGPERYALSCDVVDGTLVASATGGTAPYAYTWKEGAATTAGATLTGVAAGDYVVTVVDAASCTAGLPVEVAAAPDCGFSASAEALAVACAGQTGTIALSAVRPAGGSVRVELVGPVTRELTLATDGTRVLVEGLPAGSYDVSFADESGNLLGDTQTVIVPEPLALSVSADASLTAAADGGAGGGNRYELACHGDTGGALTATATGGTGSYKFEWSDGTVGSVATDVTAGRYRVAVTDDNGCSTPAVVEVTEPDPVTFAASPRDEGCDALAAPGGVAVEALRGGKGAYVLDIDGRLRGVTAAEFVPLPVGRHVLRVSDARGCASDTTGMRIRGAEQPTVSVATARMTVSPIAEVALLAEFSDNVAEIFWAGPGELSCTDCAAPVVTAGEGGTYTVTVRSGDGCVDTAQLRLEISVDYGVFAPTAISPDGDAVNDAFTIYSRDEGAVIEELRIYDRLGSEMYVQPIEIPTNETGVGWRGRARGQRVNPGVFVFWARVRHSDGATQIVKGDITVVR